MTGPDRQDRDKAGQDRQNRQDRQNKAGQDRMAGQGRAGQNGRADKQEGPPAAEKECTRRGSAGCWRRI